MYNYSYISPEEIRSIRSELQAEKGNFKNAVKAQKNFSEIKVILNRVRELQAILKQVRESMQQ